MDFAETLLTRAKGLGADPNVSAHWLGGDVRRLPLQSKIFAGAILIDAFGFFETDEEDEAVLSEAARVLAPAGRLGLKVVNGAPILAAFRETDCEEREGVVVTISRRLAPVGARMTETVMVRGVRGSGEYERHQRLYRPDELCRALERAGFMGVQVFASSNCATFDAASKTMWAFSQRRAGSIL
jgi:ubiquinone/menaquinone biosynthesis C-methylase UbiE